MTSFWGYCFWIEQVKGGFYAETISPSTKYLISRNVTMFVPILYNQIQNDQIFLKGTDIKIVTETDSFMFSHSQVSDSRIINFNFPAVKLSFTGKFMELFACSSLPLTYNGDEEYHAINDRKSCNLVRGRERNLIVNVVCASIWNFRVVGRTWAVSGWHFSFTVLFNWLIFTVPSSFRGRSVFWTKNTT